MSHFGPVEDEVGGTNHPLAKRMCVLAFLSYNLSIASSMGVFSVLVGAVETKLGVTRDMSTLGIPLIMVGVALTSPVAGILATKISLRLLLVTGALMLSLASAILALSTSIYFNFAAYLLLAGPGTAFCATVLPPALITRWYKVNRGRALGLVTVPLLVAAAPLIATKILETAGLTTTYFAIAATMAALAAALLLVKDYPPGETPTAAEAKAASSGGISVPQLLRSPAFWALSFAAAMIQAGAIMLSAHLIPMVKDPSWAIEATQAATLQATMGIIGMIGSLVVGWVADRLGGAGTLVLCCLGSAVAVALMLLQPAFIAMIPIVGVLGLFGAAVVPSFSLALSQQFGEANFSRVLGLGFMMAMPFNVLGPLVAARVFMATGSYAGALTGLAALFVAAGLAALAVRRRRTPQPAAAAA